jgi:hypothetical protein
MPLLVLAGFNHQSPLESTNKIISWNTGTVQNWFEFGSVVIITLYFGKISSHWCKFFFFLQHKHGKRKQRHAGLNSPMYSARASLLGFQIGISGFVRIVNIIFLATST